jgi:hypothetical protein
VERLREHEVGAVDGQLAAGVDGALQRVALRVSWNSTQFETIQNNSKRTCGGCSAITSGAAHAALAATSCTAGGGRVQPQSENETHRQGIMLRDSLPIRKMSGSSFPFPQSLQHAERRERQFLAETRRGMQVRTFIGF